jgi:hypothetical protein
MTSLAAPLMTTLTRRPLVTIGDLRRFGTMLEFTCCRCSGRRVFDPQELPFGNTQSIATAHRRMRCSFCGWQGDSAFTRPVQLPNTGQVRVVAY